jgi:hypothetical protein
MILSHTTSGMQYQESTPVTSDINTAQKKVYYSLALSIKHSLLVTQLNSTFRMGSYRVKSNLRNQA